MARLIPKVSIDEIALKPERDVARALVDQLPNDCIIYHSYPWLRAERNDRTGRDTLREGETDFVILVPTHGMLVLEVKGGEIGYEPENRRWYRTLDTGQRRDIKDPFEQASRNTHFLTDRIAGHLGSGDKKVPFAYGYAVVFPDCEYNGPAPPGADPAIIFAGSDLQFVDRRVRSALNEWSLRNPPTPLDQALLGNIQKAISPSFQLLPVLFRKVEEQEEKLFRLTEEQVRALDFLGQRDRAAIEGVAGSGKTMLARAQAQKFADQGRRTLLVCYNKALAAWLQDSIPKSYADRITVRHFHGLCWDWCQKAHVTFRPPPQNADEFWKQTAPDLLVNALDKLPDRFDAVVVDEGQDFYPNWWLPLEYINALGEGGPLFAFYDPAQNLYVKGDQAMPALGTPFTLSTNCRNTRKIATACGGIIGKEIPIHQNAPEGQPPQVVVAEGKDAQKNTVRRLLDEWLGQGRLKPAQVVILCPNTLERSSLWGESAIGKWPITDDIGRWEEGKGVLFSTIRAFKGLEADAVILMDVPKPDSVPYFTRADYYVAASRAKHLLAVLPIRSGVVELAGA